MNIVIENGWRGPIDGIASDAALVPKGETGAKVAVRLRDLIAEPDAGQEFDAGGTKWTALSTARAGATLIINCRRSADG